MSKLFKGLLLIALLAAPRWAFAYSWGDFAKDSKANFTALDSVTPAYFRDLNTGKNAGGVITSLFNVGDGALSADVGWMNTIDNSNDIGSALGGGSVHFDKLARLMFPTFSDSIRALIPPTAQKFTDKITLGFYLGHSFDPGSREALQFGLYSGMELKF